MEQAQVALCGLLIPAHHSRPATLPSDLRDYPLASTPVPKGPKRLGWRTFGWPALRGPATQRYHASGVAFSIVG